MCVREKLFWIRQRFQQVKSRPRKLRGHGFRAKRQKNIVRDMAKHWLKLGFHAVHS